MELEQLSNGNNLAKKLADLKTHLQHLEKTAVGSLVSENQTAYVRNDVPLTLNRFTSRNGNSDNISLRPEFLNMGEFLLVYKARVKDEIERLELEFKTL